MRVKKYKTIGIIGGMGSLATLDLFSKILKRVNAISDQEYPRILIDNNSSIPDRTQALRGEGMSPVPHIIETGRGLAALGAELLCMPCNTAHAFFPEIQSALPVQLISIVSETVLFIKKHYAYATRVGLLCTDGTRASRLYDREMRNAGFIPTHLSDDTQETVMEAIYGKYGIKRGHTKAPGIILQRAVQELEKKGAGVIILACTELPLAVTQSMARAALVDTTDVLAQALIRESRQ